MIGEKAEYFEIVMELRAGMPWNSGCGFDEWREFYEGIMKRMEKIEK